MTKLRIIGPGLYAHGGQGVLQPRVATILPDPAVLVTLPGTHATQREAYLAICVKDRAQAQLAPLSNEEVKQLWHSGVDLIIEPQAILIRPDPQQMELAMAADELLQQEVSKARIRFLLAEHDCVHDAIKRRGQCWRITPAAVDAGERSQRIRDSRMAIGCQPIYYYSPCTGTRLVTLQAFRELSWLDDEPLYRQLSEIQHYCRCKNRKRNLEVDFFFGDQSFREQFMAARFPPDDPPELRRMLAELSAAFADCVPPKLRLDDIGNSDWRQRIWEALCPVEEDGVLEEKRLGMATEFHTHVQWLPGGAVIDGQIDFDAVFEEPTSKQLAIDPRLDDHRAREIAFNFVRDYGDLEYINVGRIVDRLSCSPRRPRGRREVYVVQMRIKGAAEDVIKIVRVQKWDVGFRLDQGKTLLQAMIETEQYTEYTQDRYQGARRLGMNLDGPVTMGKIGEYYHGKIQANHGTPVWIPYFQRNYVAGIATDKMPEEFYQQVEGATCFAALLGKAAAANMIVGRGDEISTVFFDDGDEIVVQNGNGLPADLIVTDHTGSFWHYETPLLDVAESYARPVNVRVPQLKDPTAFAKAYLDALIDRVSFIQRSYRQNRLAYDRLFHFRRVDRDGNFAHRWTCVLKRLDSTDITALEREIKKHLCIPPRGRPL